jgi:glycosyltransferase involved in cell wall biosynthesis
VLVVSWPNLERDLACATRASEQLPTCTNCNPEVRMLVTVAICTLNRAESLRRTLASLAAMQVPDDLEWEVVVVNNNCTDHTDEVINAFVGRLPIRREFEAQRGHCNARNRAIDAAQGDYFVWTDDDVLVDTGWLGAYAEAFRKWPDAAVFGGRIIPNFEPPPPKWLADSLDRFGGAFGASDFGDCMQFLSVERGLIPVGANFAVRGIEQRNFPYNPEFGRKPGRRLIGGDEIDVVMRILESGRVGYWIPQAKVEHCIGRERQTVKYLFRYFAGEGEMMAFRTGPSDRPREVFWLGAPRWLWRETIEKGLRYRIHRWRSPSRVWARLLIDYSMTWGTIRYWRSQRG